jgi:shikimate kinase
MMFDKEKLLSVFDETVKAGTDPIRTRAGRLGVASELPTDTGLTSSSSAQS